MVLRPQTATCDRENYGLIESFAENAKKEDLEVRKAWGRHITVSRFTENIPPGQLSKFFDIMSANPLYPNASSDGDPIFANALNIGYFTLDRQQGFSLHNTYKFYI